jgi:hypothetical protein
MIKNLKKIDQDCCKLNVSEVYKNMIKCTDNIKKMCW